MNEKIYEELSLEDKMKIAKILHDRAVKRIQEIESTYGVIAYSMFKDEYLNALEDDEQRASVVKFFSNYVITQDALRDIIVKFEKGVKELKEILGQLESFSQNEEDRFWCSSAISCIEEKEQRVEGILVSTETEDDVSDKDRN